MIFVNFKTYQDATGDRAVSLAIACEVISESTHVPIIPIVQIADVYRVSTHVSIPVWVQHIDFQPPGKHTGFVSAESAVKAGARGVILNHSEHTLSDDVLSKTAKRVINANKLELLICVPSIEQLMSVKSLKPDFISYEPPDLIASKDASVASEKADIIKQAAQEMDNIPLIVGAGIKSKEDVKVSIEKGAKGILVASAVVLSDNPQKVLSELVDGFDH